jgi:hypothetical protein
MARPKRRLTAEVREERRRRDRERLERATRELLSSEGWKRWLRARATFHSYSLLISGVAVNSGCPLGPRFEDMSPKRRGPVRQAGPLQQDAGGSGERVI